MEKKTVQFEIVLSKEEKDFFRYTVPHIVGLLETIADQLEELKRSLNDSSRNG